jgi:phosphopantothenoylcysteine decarboxylase
MHLEDDLPRRPRILLCCSGSVATVKVPRIFIELSQFADVKIITSSKAAEFFLNASEQYNPLVWKEWVDAKGPDHLISEETEWTSWKKMGDPVIHIELRFCFKCYSLII